jgi:hypothetical protein
VNVRPMRVSKRVLGRKPVPGMRRARRLTKSLGLADSGLRSSRPSGPIDVVANYCAGMVYLTYCTERAERFRKAIGFQDSYPAILFPIYEGSLRHGCKLRVERIGSPLETL